MNRLFTSILAGGLLLSTATASFGDPRIAARKEHQQRRIANGITHGTMTPHQASKVEHQESNLNKEIRTDRRANGGNLTNNEKQQVNQQQNGLSREIYNDKH
jgi:hypothetical protein